MFKHSFTAKGPDLSVLDQTPTDENRQRYKEGFLYERMKRKYKGNPFALKALTHTRAQSVVATIGILGAAVFFLGPWFWGELRELFGQKFVPVDASRMPKMSPQWWENEWRKMNPVWRKGESEPNFHVHRFSFIREQTGRDLFSAEKFVESNPNRGGSEKVLHGIGNWFTKWFRRDRVVKEDRPQVLVPLCGDSPIIKLMATLGYEVDAVDASETAMRSAVERTELGLPVEYYPYIHLILQDFFSHELWETVLKGKKYDVIYERQGITSIDRDKRDDYAYLLKNALKEDGILYIEGIYRTGRVKGNKLQGPPYSLSRKDIQHLFPLSQGYHVRCEEKNDAILSLSRENKMIRRVPRELFVTHSTVWYLKRRR